MSELPGPEKPRTEERGPRHIAKNVGIALACVVMLVLAVIAGAGVLGMVVSDPTFWIAFVALCVAIAAFKASRRR